MSLNAQKLQFTFTSAFLTWVLLLLNGVYTVAQSPKFVADLDVKEVVTGVPFELTFTLTDAEGQRFTPPSFRDFKPAGGVSESRGVTFIKGQTTSKQAWTYTLEATRTGTFTIGPASVTVSGKILYSQPVTVKVLSPAASSKGAVAIPPGRDDKVFIAGSLSTQKAFAGQQVIWRLTLYTMVAIEGADLISLPDFDGFYSKERRRFDTRTAYQTIRGKKYAVKTLHEEALYPQSTGELTVGAAQIRVGIDQPGTQGFFFGPKPVTLTTQALTLKVIPLPEPVPENFTGGVGHYEWEVQADTTSLSTDDALTLTVELKGNGDARRFGAPKIDVPPTCEIFEPRILGEETNENELEMVHTKRLEYVILPKQPGTQEFVPSLTYFDVDSNRYCSLVSQPIRFEVSAGRNYHPADTTQAAPAPPVQTAVEVGFWQKLGDFFDSSVVWSLLFLSVMAAVLYLIVRKRKSRTPENTPKVGPDPAGISMKRITSLSNLRPGSSPEQFYNELLKYLQSYISARLNLSPAQMNHAVLKAKLAERRITPIRVQAFLSILQTCEQAVFSGHIDASTMDSDWRTAEVVVQELEKEMS